MELIQSKSLLAKLMATENLIVEQRNVQTASFDVQNRILTIPILDRKISSDLYDLLVGHEVGHALYTPLDGLKKAKEMNLVSSIVNVIEDARIERKIKTKYPGIRAGFLRGYRELVEKDFFGTKGVDLERMNFIDRVNIHFKSGQVQINKFTSFERQLINGIENTESFDDVIEMTKKVIEYLKKEKEERQKENHVDEPEEPDSKYEDYNDEDYEEIDVDDWGVDEEEEEYEEENYERGYSEYDFGEGTDGSNSVKSGGEQDVRSYTDESFRENESKLFANDYRYEYVNLPTIDLDEAIVDYKVLKNRIKKHYDTSITDSSDPLMDPEHLHELNKTYTENRKVVAYLAKEFELRKNAEQTKRSSIAKTGELNVNKLYSYKFSEDIFRKITVMPGGKSHGLLMYIDWSGSMDDNIHNTVKQLIALAMFCRKVNIPFEVFAFTSNYDDNYLVYPKHEDLQLGGFKLLNLFSFRMSSAEFHYMCSAMFRISKFNRYNDDPDFFSLGGTPLNESIIAASQMVPLFKCKYKLQIVNTVFLTDGESNANANMYLRSDVHEGHFESKQLGYRWEQNSKTRVVVRDPLTKQQVIVNHVFSDMTKGLLKMLKQRTDCNIIGFFILNRYQFRSCVSRLFSKAADHHALYAKFRKENYVVATSAGYDEYYLLRADSFNTDDTEELVVKENATTRSLVSAFTKYTNSRLSNRVVLNRFIGLIA